MADYEICLNLRNQQKGQIKMEAPCGITARQKERNLIKEDVQIIIGKQVFYRLYEYRGADLWYEVEIELTGERENASLGSDLTRAADIYKALFLGEVTPCTLKNIIEDCFN